MTRSSGGGGNDDPSVAGWLCSGLSFIPFLKFPIYTSALEELNKGLLWRTKILSTFRVRQQASVRQSRAGPLDVPTLRQYRRLIRSSLLARLHNNSIS